MTVCVATRSKDGHIIGASDRMLTVGSLISFAPPLSKIDQFTSSIVALYSGETAFHSEVMARCFPVIHARLQEAPSEWLSVEWIATLYRDTYLRVRASRAEAAILAPLRLTYDTFLDKSAFMAVPLVEKVRADLMRYASSPPGDGVDTIIAGRDANGPFLFRIANGTLSDETKLGFATVGNGGVNADYELMLAGYSPETTSDEALLHTYVVKRRAEVAPYVGDATDMFVIGPTPGTFQRVDEEWLNHLDSIYRRMTSSESRAFVRAAKATSEWLADLGRKQHEQEALKQGSGLPVTPPSPLPEAPPTPPPTSTDGP